MPFLKKKSSYLDNKAIEAFTKQDGCCADVDGSEQKCTVSFAVATVIEKIEIDGTEYTFTTSGATPAIIKAGIREAFQTGTPNAGYKERGEVGVTVVVNGGNHDVTVYARDATVTKLIDDVPGDHAFTCVAV